MAVPGLEKYWGTETFVTEALTQEAIKANNNCIVCFIIFLQPVHEVAKAFIHSFDKGSISSFMVGHTFLLVFIVEAHIFIQRNMDSILSHIQIKRLIVFFGFV